MYNISLHVNSLYFFFHFHTVFYSVSPDKTGAEQKELNVKTECILRFTADPMTLLLNDET